MDEKNENFNARLSISTKGSRKSALPWAVGISCVAILAGCAIYFGGSKITDAIVNVSNSMVAKQRTEQSTQDKALNTTQCIGVFVFHCQAANTPPQLLAPGLKEFRPFDPQIDAPSVASGSVSIDQTRTRSKNLKPKHGEDDPIFSRQYRELPPTELDDISMGYNDEVRKGDCFKKTYLPCYMPKGLGRETPVRPKGRDRGE